MAFASTHGAPQEIFGIHLFNLEKMKNYLPVEMYRRLTAAIEGGQRLDESVADAVACAMREWALSLGATHYTHWFQPRTEATAEKHMSFLSIDENDHPLQAFSGKDLTSSEPDASSFPNGGMRSCFEARGYCAWDPSSPAFIIMSRKGGTLCIPSVFISLDGTPLDMKTPLLKSIDAVSQRALRLLKLFGNRSVKSVDVTIGAEQEYFLIEADQAAQRPDLTLCGRALMGLPSPKAPNVEAHYLGAIHPRILDFMEDVERDMYRLGTALMTRHNEASPCQFEFAPVLAEANRGCDQNHVLMEVMRRMARRHNLKLLLHEKPFTNMNGSGKHLNFSLRDSEGRNLLKPSNNSRRNTQFLAFLCAFVLGVSKWGGLLRASIASLGNMHRLGGHEAPPSIMTVYLGDVITSFLNKLMEGSKELDSMEVDHLLDLGLNRLPQVGADNSDRNRTSPVAFTGNKFEFRGVGSPAAISGPLTVCLALWAAGIEEMADMMEAKMLDGADFSEAAFYAIQQAAKATTNARFEGNGYDPEWVNEARRRGLPVCETTIEALDQYLVDQNQDLMSKLGIMDRREIKAYHAIRLEQYVNGLRTEFLVMNSMIHEGVLPALARQIQLEGSALSYVQNNEHKKEWQEDLDQLIACRHNLVQGCQRLNRCLEKAQIDSKIRQQADLFTDEGLPIMSELRKLCDYAERRVAADLWPYPTIRDLLTIRNKTDK